jgi:hypothetical protein
MWKSTPERCGKQVENFCYSALWGVTTDISDSVYQDFVTHSDKEVRN